MTLLPNTPIPNELLEESVLACIAAAWFSVGRQLEAKTGCSATRGFILSALSCNADMNQNRLATLLGLDRTVVHRAVKSMVRERLISEKKATEGRSIALRLTRKGVAYHQRLIAIRRAADDQVRKTMPPSDQADLVRLLKVVADLDL